MNLKLTIIFLIVFDTKVFLDNKEFTFPMEYYMIEDAKEFRESLIELEEDSDEEDSYNPSIYSDDKGQVSLIDNSLQLFVQQNYKECRKEIINDLDPNLKIPDTMSYIKFNTPSKLCPNIKNSCCTKNNIRTMGFHFLAGVKKFRTMFRTINHVFKLYFKKKNIIMDMLKYYMSNPIANCINIKPDEVYNLFYGFQNDYVDTSQQVDEFVNTLLKYQSGLMCTVCDLSYNHLIGWADQFRMIIHWDQCRQLTMDYFLFLPSVYQIYRIAAAVNFLQCQLFEIKAWTINIDFDPFIQEFKEVTDCINQYDNPEGDIRHCLRICRDLTQIGVYNDIPKVLKIANQLQEFYYDILAQAPSIDDEDDGIKDSQTIKADAKENIKKEPLFHRNITYSFYEISKTIHEREYDVYVDKYYGLYPTQNAMKLENIFAEFISILNLSISLFILIN